MEGSSVSYCCLIYKSIKWLKFVYDQFHRYTILNEDDEFFFVANDATDEVISYLQDNNIKHYIHNNTEEERKQWYIRNVYRGYNLATKKAKGEYIIYLNSDFAFSKDWNINLFKNIRDDNCVCSRLVEPNNPGKYGIQKNFGKKTINFREIDFNKFVRQIKQANILKDGGLYMPLLIKKEHMVMAQYYPEGNIDINSDIFNPIYLTAHQVYKLKKKCMPGDKVLMAKLATLGIKHQTAFDSVVYHFQQGESSEP